METMTAPTAGGRKVARKQPRNDKQMKVDAEVLRNVQLVCTYRGTQMAEYVSEILRPIVARDLAEEQRKAQAPEPPARSPLPGQTSFIEPGKGRKSGAKSK